MAALLVNEISHLSGGKMALDAVSLAVTAGCFTTLLAIDGTGKITVFKFITWLYGARAGWIQVCGHDLRLHPRQALAQPGTAFQSPSFDFDLRVRKNLYYHGALHGPGMTLAAGRKMLDRLRVGELLDYRVATLSGDEIPRGNRPRLAAFSGIVAS